MDIGSSNLISFNTDIPLTVANFSETCRRIHVFGSFAIFYNACAFWSVSVVTVTMRGTNNIKVV